jgi:tumor protein p53-inducible protein 3
MKAILVDDKTKSLLIGEADDPVLTEDDLLVRVAATALNRADLLQRLGLYPPPPGASSIMGLEMAGVVEKVGAKAAGLWKPGDRVCALLPGGGYAQLVSIPAGMAMRVPEPFSLEEAAAIPEVFLTAFLNLFVLGGLKPHHTVLIHAGASGVGTAAIQMVREAGAKSIVTAGNEEKRSTCLRLGATAAIDYHAGPFASQVKELTGGRGADILLDFIGATYWEQNLESMATDGRLIVLGTMGGSRAADLDLGLLLRRRLQVIGSSLRSRSTEDKIELTRQFSEFAMPLLADGRLKPVIDSVWEWQQVNEAHAHMEQNRNTGKIVLRINE